MAQVRCAFCRELAARYFVTLDNTIWSVCEHDAAPFIGTAVELDPEQYDVESHFSRVRKGETG